MPDAGVRVDPLHCIHTKNGHFGTQTRTQADDIDRMLDAFFESPDPPTMVIHFHGGLVSFDVGARIAQDLTPLYEGAGAFPVFFLWESGAFEAIANNLGQIAQGPLFRELVGKVLKFAIGQLGGIALGKGDGFTAVDPAQIAIDVDNWFEGRSTAVPFEDVALAVRTEGAKGLRVDEGALELQIQADLELDQRIADLIAEGSDVRLMSAEGRELIAEPTEPGFRGPLTALKVAAAVLGLVKSVLLRVLEGRDHGLFATVLEELYSALYFGKLGQALLWDQMKQDTADAFAASTATDGVAGGTAFLAKLAERIRAGAPVPRIVLVGHSAGSIYLCNFLDAADADELLPPDMSFEVVLLAPAVRFARFIQTVHARSQRIKDGCVRLFGMADKVEQDDAMAVGRMPAALAPFERVVYPHSLLYFISGVLERPDPDAPLLGMQRFFADRSVFDARTFPEIDAARKYLDGRTVWSVTGGGEPLGQRSHAMTHGGFDNDTATLESLAHIVRNGFRP